MFDYKLLEVVSQEDCFKIALKDAPSQTARTAEEYAKENVLTYYIAVNTWIMLWKAYTRFSWSKLASEIAEEGLIPAINTMQEEAMRIIQDEPLGTWGQILFKEIEMKKNFHHYLNNTTIGWSSTSTVLMLLRYPKRFSPNGNDIIQEKTLLDFIAYEKRSKRLQRLTRFNYDFVMMRVRDVIANMYDWSTICDEIDALAVTDIRFSNGAAIDAKPALGSKVQAIIKDGNLSDYILPIFGVYTLDRKAVHRPEPRVSRVQAVPKSYKSSRIIAVEKTYPIAKGKAIENIFRFHDKRNGEICLEDQSINQKLAQLGSYDGSVATLDASHASDLITKTLFYDLFPPQYTKRVKELLPEYVEYMHPQQGKVRISLQMASTSGHTLTFRHETIVYKAIAVASLAFAKSLGIQTKKNVAWAYGDDTIVSSEAYDIALYFFRSLGLLINEDKSYAEGRYRESCGEEYLDSVPVTSLYYPRFPVVGKISKNRVTLDSDRIYNDSYRGKLDNSITMLIDLQKKIYPISDEAATFIASIIQSAYPSITASAAGEVCNDLWDIVDTGKVYRPRKYRLEHVGKYKYPRVSKAVSDGYAEDALSDENRKIFHRLSSLDTLHRYPSVVYTSDRSFTEFDEAVYEYYMYQTFLRHGPQFEDELLEMLGITKRPMTIEEFYGKRTFKLKTAR